MTKEKKKRTADGQEQNAGKKREKKKMGEARAWRSQRNEELGRKK